MGFLLDKSVIVLFIQQQVTPIDEAGNKGEMVERKWIKGIPTISVYAGTVAESNCSPDDNKGA
jgi:hypothetical protein